MPGTTTTQPRWGRAFVALIAIVVLIAFARGAWEIAVATAIVALLVGAHVLRRQARRQLVYDRHGARQ